jgi:hypothetical protein
MTYGKEKKIAAYMEFALSWIECEQILKLLYRNLDVKNEPLHEFN